MNTTKRLLAAAGFATLLCAAQAKAQLLSFAVDIKTAALVDDTYPPFALDFQLNQGSGSASSTVTLSNFQFTGGSAVAGSAVISGLASGDLTSTVTLGSDNSSHFFNDFTQQFTAGTTDIKFTATVSQAFTGLTPTGFSAAILDNSFGFPAQIYTTDPNDGLSLVTLGIAASNKLSDVGAFTSVDPTPLGITATVTAIPEPAETTAFIGLAVAIFAYCRRRRAPEAASAV